MLGLVFRIDILGGYIPSATNLEDKAHDIFGELFLITCQVVNRYKLHQSRFVCVAVCCSMLQCVACSVLQCVAVVRMCHMQSGESLQAAPEQICVLCSALQCVAVCCIALRCFAVRCSVLQCVTACCSMLQRVAACCSVLQRVAACCSVLQ